MTFLSYFLSSIYSTSSLYFFGGFLYLLLSEVLFSFFTSFLGVLLSFLDFYGVYTALTIDFFTLSVSSTLSDYFFGILGFSTVLFSFFIFLLEDYF